MDLMKKLSFIMIFLALVSYLQAVDKLYVSNFNTSEPSISVVNTSTNIEETKITTTDPVISFYPSPDGTKLYYITLAGASSEFGCIDTIKSSIDYTLPVGNNPLSFLVTSDGEYAYVANYDSDTVSIINTLNRSVIKTIDVGHHPKDITISPTNDKIYVCNTDSNDITVIDTATQSVTKTISNISNPNMMIILGDKGYVLCNRLVLILNLQNDNTEAAQILINQGNFEALGNFDKNLYVLQGVESDAFKSLEIFASTNLYPELIIEQFGSPNDLIFSKNQQFYYVSHAVTSGIEPKVIVYDGTTNKHITSLPSSYSLNETISSLDIQIAPIFSLSTNGERLYYTNPADNSVSVIDIMSNTYLQTIRVGSQPSACIMLDVPTYSTRLTSILQKYGTVKTQIGFDKASTFVPRKTPRGV